MSADDTRQEEVVVEEEEEERRSDGREDDELVDEDVKLSIRSVRHVVHDLELHTKVVAKEYAALLATLNASSREIKDLSGAHGVALAEAAEHTAQGADHAVREMSTLISRCVKLSHEMERVGALEKQLELTRSRLDVLEAAMRTGGIL